MKQNKARFFCISVALVLLLSAFNAAELQAQSAPEFPESHEMIMGGGSYMVHFGIDARALTPASPSAPGGTGQPPRVGPNVVVNDPQFPFPNGLLGRSETTIASDPSGRFLLVGWNDADGFCGPPFNVPCVPAIPTGPGLNGFGFSSDGGQTWIDGGAPFAVVTPGGTKVTRADPWMDTGGPGQQVYYYATLASDTMTTSPGFGGVLVYRGEFQQSSFSFNNGTFIPQPNPLPNDFLDKEALCAGKTGGIQDEVTVTVTNFKEIGGVPFAGFGQIEAYVSADRASSFPVRTLVQPDESSIPAVNQGSTCAYGPNGELYALWERGFVSPFNGQGAAGVFPEIYFAASFNGGLSFGARTLVSSISAPGLFPPGGYSRGNYNDFPRLAVAQSGPFRGRIYAAYQSSEIANGGAQPAPPGPEDALCALIFGFAVDCGHPDSDAYIRFSDDGGATWSGPILVAGGGDGKLQFWPLVTVQPDGDVVVTYNESVDTTVPDLLNLDGLGTSLVDVFTATSTDGGVTFGAPLKVTEVTTDWGAAVSNINPNFGDYIFTVSIGNKDLVTWADGRNGVPDTFYATVKTQ